MDLIDAANNADLDLIRRLVTPDNVNIRDGAGHTPLMIAASNGYMETVELLLSNGANVDLQDKMGDSALMLAVLENYLNMVKLLVEAGADLQVRNNHGETPLLNAIYYGNLDMIKYLLEVGALIDIVDNDGNDAITSANYEFIHLKDVPATVELVQNYLQVYQDTHPDDYNEEGITNLMLMVSQNNINALNYWGMGCPHRGMGCPHRGMWCPHRGMQSIVNYQDPTGKTALHYAVFGGSPEGVGVDTYPAYHLRKDVIKILLEMGADPTIEDNNGYTPWDYADQLGNQDIIQMMEAKIFQEDQD